MYRTTKSGFKLMNEAIKGGVHISHRSCAREESGDTCNRGMTSGR